VNRVPLREHVPSVLVALIGSAFGVALLQVTLNLGTMIRADDRTGSSGTAALMLTLAASVFIVIAVYVAAIVTANTFATVIAGRTRTIALLRLVGATAASRRRAVAREGLTVGIVGGLLGAAVGLGLAWAGFTAASALGAVPDLAYGYTSPVLLVPVLAVVLTTWLASWIGSRRVLTVSPMQATGESGERSTEDVRGSRRRHGVAVALMVAGLALLAGGILIGLVTPAGVLVAMVGGILSFTGLVQGSQLIMPPALRLVGRVLGRSASSRLAAENALRYPERSSRTTIGLVIGVTLITMFAVAVESYAVMVRAAQEAEPETYAGIDEIFALTLTVFSVLIGFSALIACVGMVNNLSLSVLQRTRELGLLRALGFTKRQLRSMILAESAQLTVAAVLVGLVLGVFYGWAGAQSLLGAVNGSPGVILPAVPLGLVAVLVVAAALLTAVASVAPTRRATRIAPVVALAVG
jgi:putative ABC transport system permease protein